eukprot:1417553-Amphidinium_carterae.1
MMQIELMSTKKGKDASDVAVAESMAFPRLHSLHLDTHDILQLTGRYYQVYNNYLGLTQNP